MLLGGMQRAKEPVKIKRGSLRACASPGDTLILLVIGDLLAFGKDSKLISQTHALYSMNILVLNSDAVWGLTLCIYKTAS